MGQEQKFKQVRPVVSELSLEPHRHAVLGIHERVDRRTRQARNSLTSSVDPCLCAVLVQAQRLSRSVSFGDLTACGEALTRRRLDAACSGACMVINAFLHMRP